MLRGKPSQMLVIYLLEHVLSHGELYLALSRGVSLQTTRILAKPNKEIYSTAFCLIPPIYREYRGSIPGCIYQTVPCYRFDCTKTEFSWLVFVVRSSMYRLCITLVDFHSLIYIFYWW